MDRSLQIINFGKKEFSDFYNLNNRLWLQRLANDITDTLIFVEHPHVIIMGNGAENREVTFPYAIARRDEINTCQVDWTGQSTYRGPGQLIIYPVIHLQRHGLSFEEITCKIESVLIHLLNRYGIKAHPTEQGIGVNGSKIAYIDWEAPQNVTKFSIALNVNPRLSLLRMFQLEDSDITGVTSMYYLLKKKIDIRTLKRCFTDQFQRELGYKAENVSSF
ncbi:MAG: lipoyl(octanoyl) transferase LipB [Bacillota bacterium]|jgi:lipoyl(octanoyl) transferase